MIYRSGPVMGSGQRRGRSRWRRLAPNAGAAVLAFRAGAVLGGRHVPASQQVAERFASAWQAGDFARMHALSDAGAHGRSLREFAAAYRDAAETATVRTMRFGEARDAGDSVVAIPAVVE